MAVKKTYEVVGTKKTLTRSMKVMVKAMRDDDTYTYVARYLKLKGKTRPVPSKGRMSTSDPALISALDSRIERAGEKTGIICVKEEKIPDSQAERTPKIVETISGEERFEDNVDPTMVKKNKPYIPDPTPVPGVTTMQAAAKWLRDNFEDVKSRDVSNKELVTRVAEQKNVKFVDLE